MAAIVSSSITTMAPGTGSAPVPSIRERHRMARLMVSYAGANAPMSARSLVILPTYNERENLERIVAAILEQDPEFEVLVVDDNSPDGTGEIADGLSTARAGRVHVLHRPGKQGLGTAYIQGFLWALARAYDYVFEMDADFSHDPNDLPRMRGAVQHGADVAVGSRWVAGGGTRNWSFLRTFISRGGSIYARLILGIPVNDLTSGFKCFSRHVLEQLD